jgi:sRNA-binding protein
LRRALHAYTADPVYCRKLLAGGPRYDLDGGVAGTITGTEAADALAKLAAANKRAADRRQQSRTAQPAQPVQLVEQPKRGDGLAALKAAAQRRKAGVEA